MRNNLIIKEVNFQNSQLMAVQNKETKKIYVGINYILKGIGFEDRQIEYQRNKWSNDKVILKGVQKFSYPSENGGVQETYCISIKKLPLALAKINITPKINKENPILSKNLEIYQDKCAEVLEEAFIDKTIPKTLQEALREYADTLDKLELEKAENEKLKPKADNFDLFMNTTEAIDMGNFAKAINITKDGKLIGRNTLFKYLRDKKILMNSNIPYQRFIKQQLFEVIEIVKYNKNFSKTMVTPKGVEYIIKMLRKDGYIVEEVKLNKNIV